MNFLLCFNINDRTTEQSNRQTPTTHKIKQGTKQHQNKVETIPKLWNSNVKTTKCKWLKGQGERWVTNKSQTGIIQMTAQWVVLNNNDRSLTRGTTQHNTQYNAMTHSTMHSDVKRHNTTSKIMQHDWWDDAAR